MQKRPFGNTGLEVSVLGFGAGHVGGNDLSEDQAGTLLNRALDLGINLIDSAKGYDQSEARIGRHLSWRRSDFILSTKGGYGVEGAADWSYDCIVRGVEQAMRTCQTDYLDIFHLHSCPQETLERDDLWQALEFVQEQGWVRVVAYSGENAALAYAMNSGKVGSVQTSVNLFDQHSLLELLPQAPHLGVIAKRPIGNAPWRFAQRPVGDYAEVYWERWKTMNLELGSDPLDLALRFTAFALGVSSSIVGTRDLKHLTHNVDTVKRGPLEGDVSEKLNQMFVQHGKDWAGQV
jgi:aryl-alcohol dehydrogenase-like predicted oxidoreductase